MTADQDTEASARVGHTPPSRAAARHARASAGSRHLSTSWQIFSLLTLACLLRGTGEFVYDALGYWRVNLALMTDGSVAAGRHFPLRGVLTAITFAPAALATKFGGTDLAGFAVLLQNSLLIAFTAAFLVPRAIAPWRQIGTKARWGAGAVMWIALQGFAPYPLVDLYAAVAVLAAVVCLEHRRPWALVGAGALLGYAINLRPAYLPVAALLAVATLATHRLRTAWAALGTVLVGFAPQMVFNYLRYGSLSPSPIATGRLVGLQTGYAAYIVRYDTAPWRGLGPQQFFCSPAMANSVEVLPRSTSQLMMSYVRALPDSALFALEKVAASLHWPVSVPYLVDQPGLNAVYVVVITTIAVVGCAALVAGPFIRRASTARRTWEAWSRTSAVIAGSILTLAGAATEARFALPLVLLGVLGIASLVDVGTTRLRGHPRALAAAALGVVLVVGLGYVGLAHPAPPGDARKTVCAQM